MVWIYNSRSGAVDHLPANVANLLLKSGQGFHGPFNSEQEILDYYNSNKGANPGWHAPEGDFFKRLLNTVSSAPSDALSSAKNNILGNVNVQSWFLRIGEILFGLILVGVGIAKLTGTANVISKAMKVI
jgi:hypothetical protein